MNFTDDNLRSHYEQLQVRIAEAELETLRIANARAQAELDTYRRQNPAPRQPVVDTLQTTGVNTNRWVSDNNTRTPQQPTTRRVDPFNHNINTVGAHINNQDILDWTRTEWAIRNTGDAGELWTRTETDSTLRT